MLRQIGAITGLAGELCFINNKEVHIPIEFEKGKKTLIQLCTGASYSQISTRFAEYLQLKSHPKLIGLSRSGNAMNCGYLAQASITLNGIHSSLLFKVGPDEPHILGLNAMIHFDLKIDPVRATFTQGTTPISSEQSHRFDFINLEAHMAKLGIKNEDLVSIQDLPNPRMAYRDMLEAGSKSNVIDLGTGYSSSSTALPGYYLGTS